MTIPSAQCHPTVPEGMEGLGDLILFAYVFRSYNFEL